MENIMLRIEDVSKRYRLGQIGGTTLSDELKRKLAKLRKRDDPTKVVGEKDIKIGESFMALSNISFDVKKGERVGLIGHNGAGKSTLLKLVSRITAPSSGKIGLNGRITSMLEVGTGFHGELTGRENIYMNGAILGMTKKEIDSKIEQIIEFSECGQFIDTPVKRYSSGMYVKLAFSVASHLDSEIMIMDEVLAVGDVAFQRKCLGKMNEVSRTEGRTILYVSHNMDTIRNLCDRVIVMDHGKIIFDGDTEKGISVYLGCNHENLPCHYDLDSVVRPYPNQGISIRILSFDFLTENDMAIFNKDETIKFRIKFKANESIPGLRLYFVICDESEKPVGMTQSFSGFSDAEKGKEYTHDFEMDLRSLSAGNYMFYADIYSMNERGKHWSYDHPAEKIFFSVKDLNHRGLNWNNNYGRVSLPEITSI